MEEEVARIKAEREQRKKEVKAAIQKVLSEMSEEELKVLKEEVLAKVEVFYRSLSSYGESCEKDVRDWGDANLVEIYFTRIRDRLIRERYLKEST